MKKKKFNLGFLILLVVLFLSFTATACNFGNKNPQDRPTPTESLNIAVLESDLINILQLNTIDNYDIDVFHKEQSKAIIKEFCIYLKEAKFPQAKADKLVSFLQTQKNSLLINNFIDYKTTISSFFKLELTSDDFGLLSQSYIRALLSTLTNESVYNNSESLLDNYLVKFSGADKNTFDNYAKIYTAKEVYGLDSFSLVENDLSEVENDLSESDYNKAKALIDSASDGNTNNQPLTYNDAITLLNEGNFNVGTDYIASLKQYIYYFSKNLLNQHENTFNQSPVRQDALSKYNQAKNISDLFDDWRSHYAHNGFTAESSSLNYISNILSTYKTIIVDSAVTIPTSVTSMNKDWITSTVNALNNDIKTQQNTTFDYLNYAKAVCAKTKINLEKENIKTQNAILDDEALQAQSLLLIKNASSVLYKGLQTFYGNTDSFYAILKNEYNVNDINALTSSVKAVVNEINTFFVENENDINQLTFALSEIDFSVYPDDIQQFTAKYCTMLNIAVEISTDVATIINNIIDCCDVNIINGLLSFKSDSIVKENFAIYSAKFIDNFKKKYTAESLADAIMNIVEKLPEEEQLIVVNKIKSYINLNENATLTATAIKQSIAPYFDIADCLIPLKNLEPATSTVNDANYNTLIAEINKIELENDLQGLHDIIISLAVEVNKFLNQRLNAEPIDIFANAIAISINQDNAITLPPNSNTYTVVYKFVPTASEKYKFVSPNNYVTTYFSDGVTIQPDYNQYDENSFILYIGITYYFVVTVDADYNFKIVSAT